MVLLDEAFVGLLDRRGVGARFEPQDCKCGGSAGHGNPV
jgi:hypothetical protein